VPREKSELRLQCLVNRLDYRRAKALRLRQSFLAPRPRAVNPAQTVRLSNVGPVRSRVAVWKVPVMSDPLNSVVDDLLAALDPSGAIDPGLARSIGRQLRRWRQLPASPMSAADGATLCAPYLLGFPIDGAAISTVGSSFGGETVAASDPTAALLDEIQLDLRQGPCWDAVEGAVPITIIDTVTDTRWPLFADAVSQTGIRAVFAFPLHFAGLPIGAVDVYSRTPGPLTNTIIDGIAAASDTTSLRVLAAVLGENAVERSNTPSSRLLLDQATEMILARYRITAEDALLLLRAHAFTHDRTITDVARDVVHRQGSFPDDPATSEVTW
jgi:hypothetical protein